MMFTFRATSSCVSLAGAQKQTGVALSWCFPDEDNAYVWEVLQRAGESEVFVPSV